MSAISRASIAIENRKNQHLKPISAKQLIDIVRFLTSFDILAKIRRWCEYHAYLDAVEDVAHSFVPNPANQNSKKKKKNKTFDRKTKDSNNNNGRRFKNRADDVFDIQSDDTDEEEAALASAAAIARQLTPEQLEKIRSVIQQSAKLVLGPMHINSMINEDEEIRSTADAARSLQQVEHQNLSVLISPLSSLGGVILKYCERYPKAEGKWVTEFQMKTIGIKKIDATILLERVKEAIEGDVLDVKYSDPEEQRKRKNPREFAAENILDQAKRRSASPDFSLYREELMKADREKKKRDAAMMTSSLKNAENNNKDRQQKGENNNDEEEKESFFQKHRSVYSPPPALVSILTPLPSAENLARSFELSEAILNPYGNSSNNNIKKSSGNMFGSENNNNDGDDSEAGMNNNTDNSGAGGSSSKYRVLSPEEKQLIKAATEQLIPVLFQLIDAKSLGVISLEQLSDFCAAIILSTEQAQSLQVDMLPAYKLRNANFSAFAARHSKIVPDLLMHEKVLSFIGIPENVSTSPMAHVTCTPERLVAPIPNNKLRKDFEDSMLDKKVRYLLLSQKQQQIEKKNKELNLPSAMMKNRKGSSSKGGGGAVGSIQHAKEVLKNEMDPSKASATFRVIGEDMVEKRDFTGFIGVDIVLLHDVGLYACSNTVGEIIFFTADHRAQVVCSTPRSPSSITALATCRNLYRGRNAQKKQLLVACDRSGRVMFWEIERVNIRETTVTSKKVQMLHHPVRFAWIHEKSFVLVLIAGENQVILNDMRKFVLGLEQQSNNNMGNTNNNMSLASSFNNNVASRALSNFASNILIGSFPTRAVITTAALSVPLNGLFVCGALDGPELIPLGCVAGEMSTTPTPLIASSVNPNQQSQSQQQEATSGNKTGTSAMSILHDIQAAQKKAILSCCCDPQLPQGLSVDSRLTVTVWDLRRMTPTQCVTVNVPDVFFQPKMFSICVAKGRRRCAMLTDGAHALWFERPVDQRTLTVTFGNESYEVIDDDANNNADKSNDNHNNNNDNDKNGGEDGEKNEDMFDDDEAVAREADAAAPVIALFEYNQMILVVTERTVSLWKNTLETDLYDVDEERDNDENYKSQNDEDPLAGSVKFSTTLKNKDTSKDKKKETMTDQQISDHLNSLLVSGEKDSSSSSPKPQLSIVAMLKKNTQDAIEKEKEEKERIKNKNTLPKYCLEVDRDLDNSCRKLYLVGSAKNKQQQQLQQEGASASSAMIQQQQQQDKWVMITRGTLPDQCTVYTAAFNSERLVVGRNKNKKTRRKHKNSLHHDSSSEDDGDDIAHHEKDYHHHTAAASSMSFSYPCSGRAHLLLALTNGDLIFVHPVTIVVLHTIKNVFDPDNLSPPHDSWNEHVPNFVSVEEKELAQEQDRTSKMLSSTNSNNNNDINNTNEILKRQEIASSKNKRSNNHHQLSSTSSSSPLISSICFIGDHDIAVCQEATGTIVIIQDYFMPQTGSRWNARRVGTNMISCNTAGGNGQQDQLPFSSSTIRAVFSSSSAKDTLDICLFSTKFCYFWPLTLISLSKKSLGIDEESIQAQRRKSSMLQDGQQPQDNEINGNDNNDDGDHSQHGGGNQQRIVAFLTNPMLVVEPTTSSDEKEVENNNNNHENDRRRKNLLNKMNRRRVSAISSMGDDDEQGDINTTLSDEEENDHDDDNAKNIFRSNHHHHQNQHPHRGILVLSHKVVILDLPDLRPANDDDNDDNDTTNFKDQHQHASSGTTLGAEDTIIASFDTCHRWRRFEEPISNTVAILEKVRMVHENDHGVDDEENNKKDENESVADEHHDNDDDDHVILFLGRSDGTLSVYDLTSFFFKKNTNSNNKNDQRVESFVSTKSSAGKSDTDIFKSSSNNNNITLISRYRITRRSLYSMLFPLSRDRLVILDDSKVVTSIPLEKLLRPPLDIETSFDVPFTYFIAGDDERMCSSLSERLKAQQKELMRRKRRGGSIIISSSDAILNGGDDKNKQNNEDEQEGEKIDDEEARRQHELLKPDYSAFDNNSSSNENRDDENAKEEEDAETENTYNNDGDLEGMTSPVPKEPSSSSNDKSAVSTKRLSVAERLRSVVSESSASVSSPVVVHHQMPSSSLSKRAGTPSVVPRLPGPSLFRSPSSSSTTHAASNNSDSKTISKFREQFSKTPQVMTSAFLALSKKKHRDSISSTNHEEQQQQIDNNRGEQQQGQIHHQHNVDNLLKSNRSISPTSRRLLADLASSPEAAERTTSSALNQVRTFLKDAEEKGSFSSSSQNTKSKDFSHHHHQSRRPSTPLEQGSNSDHNNNRNAVPDVDKRFVEPSGSKIIKKHPVSQTLLGLYKRKPM